MNKWMKKLTAALCAAVLMCGMAVTAYAGHRVVCRLSCPGHRPHNQGVLYQLIIGERSIHATLVRMMTLR